MFVKAHPPKGTPGKNKGSCGLLLNYLRKEDKEQLPGGQFPFFSHYSDQVDPATVGQAIDSNNRNLGHGDIKYYMLSISPSYHEQQHLIDRATGKQKVTDISQLSSAEQAKVQAALMDYSRKVMDLYARNFNRPNVQDGADLVYFGKMETARKWKATDKEVVAGTAMSGQPKPGLQLHVHVIVSRNDRSQTTKLSPLSKSKGGQQMLNGKPVMQGFHHVTWKQAAGNLFQQEYDYIPKAKDTYKQNDVMTADSAAGQKAAQDLTNRLQSIIRQQATQGHFVSEQKALSAAKVVISLAKNPAAGAAALLKNKLQSIIKGPENEK